MLASEFDWSDTSYLHAMMHVENAIRNLRADARAAQAERDQCSAEADEMRECLRWYVKNDDTMRGGRWEEANEPWLAGKRRAMRALGIGEDE